MTSSFSEHSGQDIELVIGQIHGIVDALAQSGPVNPLIQAGQKAAQKLYAMASVRQLPHIEHYAAQLVQIFLHAEGLIPGTLDQEALEKLKAAEADFCQASSLLQAQSSSWDEFCLDSPQLDGLIETLYQQGQPDIARETTLPKNAPPKTDVTLLSVAKGFSPWLSHVAKVADKEIRITFDIPPTLTLRPHMVDCIQTVFTHLLRNALFHGIESRDERHLHGKSTVGHIHINAESMESLLRISITDDGRGMSLKKAVPVEDRLSGSPSAFAGNLTETQAQTSITETSIFAVKNQNTGLSIGLPIVRNQLKRQGGELELKSIPSIGTSAIIHIPLNG